MKWHWTPNRFLAAPDGTVYDWRRAADRMKSERRLALLQDLADLMPNIIEIAHHGMPVSCGRCGTPDAQCDGGCADAHYASVDTGRAGDLLRQLGSV